MDKRGWHRAQIYRVVSRMRTEQEDGSMEFVVEKGHKQNLFCLLLNGMNKEYKVKEKNGNIIFSVKKPAFSQDEVLINMFYNELLQA